MYLLGVIIIPLFFYLLYKIDHIESLMVEMLRLLDRLQTTLKEDLKRK